MAMPPSPLTAFKPKVPSVTVPERIIHIAFSPSSSDIDLKKQSMGKLIPSVIMGSINWIPKWFHGDEATAEKIVSEFPNVLTRGLESGSN